jgi:hypothetical protein
MFKLFRNPRAVVILIGIFLIAFLASLATKCRAETATFEVGRAIIHGETPAIGLNITFGEQYGVGHDLQDFNYQCGLLLIGANGPNSNQIAAQCLVVDGFGRFDLGLGLAALQNSDQWNSGRVNFALMARYRFTERMSLTYRHISNAGTHLPNIGRDMIFAAWTFK